LIFNQKFLRHAGENLTTEKSLQVIIQVVLVSLFEQFRLQQLRNISPFNLIG
jgi:hypothetical protein